VCIEGDWMLVIMIRRVLFLYLKGRQEESCSFIFMGRSGWMDGWMDGKMKNSSIE
jgi:hypothetical protein